MILRWVRLKNIRSYLNQKIEFLEGSTLLSGDIGSGKSTILLSIEFSLFGLLRGTLNGESLLRHGTSEGSVELCFSVDNKEIIIRRGLRRQMGSVSQTTGYIMIDGIKHDGTAIELKSKVLSLLGYPESLITKSKSLIFRYTVYTPQEMMKHILFDETEARLDTLRKIFGIDKYKNISNNIAIASKNIRDRRKELSGQFSDLDEKIQQKLEHNEKISTITLRIRELEPKFEEVRIKISEINSLVKSKQEDISILKELTSEFSSLKSTLEEKENACKKYTEQKEQLLRSINELRARINEFDPNIDQGSIKEEINGLERNLEKNQRAEIEIKTELRNITEKLNENMDSLKKLREESIKLSVKEKEYSTLVEDSRELPQLQEKLSNFQEDMISITSDQKEFEVKIDASENLKNRITELTECPTCLQPVTQSHKELIITTEQKKIDALSSKRQSFLSKKDELHINIAALRSRISIIINNNLRLAELKSQIERIITDQEESMKKSRLIDELEEKKRSVDERFSKLQDTENLKRQIQSKKNILEQLSKKDLLAQQITDKSYQLTKVESEIKELENIMIGLKDKKTDAYNKYMSLKDSHEEYKKLHEEYNLLKEKENDLNVVKATLEKDKENILSIVSSLDKEIEKKRISKEYFGKLTITENWLSEYFVKLMGTMERQVLYKIYNEFNSYFVSWFNMLIEDDLLFARLGGDFTPVISQNGYETNIENLSGGEKTAVALAYRLALNKVINDLVSTIKTSDIIILDEPTDGFSSEQLDKVREVLDMLGVKQTIIVSHEVKIETFVENVIRVSKREHESLIG